MGVVDRIRSQTVIDDPIINSPLEEPRRHYRFGDAGKTVVITACRAVAAKL
jgi:hypothetical protein